MRAGLVIGMVAGCGRIGFDPAGADPGDQPPIQLHWTRTFPVASGSMAHVAAVAPDGAGAVAIVAPFTGTITVDGVQELSIGSSSSLVAELAADKTTTWSHVVRGTDLCDLRAIDFVGGNVVAGGFTAGALAGTGDPCDAGGGATQDPILIEYTRGGAFVTRTVLDAVGSNGQLYEIRSFPDGSRAVYGNYGSQLTVNGVVLPTAATAQFDAAFIARVGGTTTWQQGVVSSTIIIPEDIAVATDDDVCVTGGFDSPTTILGVPLDPVGTTNGWVARLDPTGNPRFVRRLGATGTDVPAGVVATADGGCLVESFFTGTMDLGGAVGTIASVGGGDVGLVAFDATGTAISASVIGSPGDEGAFGLASTGTAVYAVVKVTAPITIADTEITPQGGNIAIVELSGATPLRVVERIEGTGNVGIFHIAGRGGELALAGSFIGEIRIGELTETAVDQTPLVLSLGLN